ncbi:MULTISPECIES: SIS domain-containing protein [Atopobiaceae]|uniref:Uncharacterized protein, contains SIS (Sugar ISomerase) phosphosugar binding domain n=1 Tax=Parafannyhessea umbonata TaxID=604330 RepID=A0A1H6I680_9ACTN|nr:MULTISPECIES: SIS domain-containing protein [Atopobiaceae]SEH43679.1 Uncharacterized protein, contains SIS (Sugar ISomerase) phosphosugar binding domain [Parafannyhessea umbonata]SJZ58473.1 Uncharacterized protein, contains SIS (Sugar ISomerase) phosphosugar binding domain [Olsenella sp. KH1P3]
MRFEYIGHVKELIEEVEATETPAMEECVDVMASAILDGKSIFIFGASHAGILSQESFYRAGGLMPITPMWGDEVLVNREPITLTSKMERCVGYGAAIASAYPLGEGDVLIVHSVSGRNPVTIEVALAGRDAGCTVVGITNLAYSKSVTSRHPSGKRLFELCDIVLDNHGERGDACVEVVGAGVKAGPTSTVVGAMMLNAIYAEVANELVRRGLDIPPVFYSANVDGGDEKNALLHERYQGQMHYRF